VSSYHLFYADEIGNPGTDLTFFDIPRMGGRRPGAASISNVGLRVRDTEALNRWAERLTELGVEHDAIEERAGRRTLGLRDFEGQRLVLVADDGEDGVPGGTPWEKGPVPSEWAIRGLGPVTLTVNDAAHTARTLTDVMGFREQGSYRIGTGAYAERLVFATGQGGAGAEVHISERPDLPREQLGRGSVHHVAFRVPNDEEY
ncbi:glyoxalase/bleomycin resistance protein/dioxygenase, partial [mine drainage metagenome]